MVQGERDVGCWRQTCQVLLLFGGILSGPVVLSFVTIALYWLFDPRALRDGQFAMIVFVTVPFGLLLGGVVGASSSLLCVRERRRAGKCARTGGAVVMILSILFLLLGLSLFGLMEVLLVIAVAGGLSIMGWWLESSAIRAENWARSRRAPGQALEKSS